jgi:tetratricopeptide (TPR) repeat protein
LRKQIKLGIVALLLVVPLKAQVSVMESLWETVGSRWDFQQKFPLSVKLLASSATEEERLGLIGQLRIAQPRPAADSLAPTFADLWADLVLGLALEKAKVGAGEAELTVVAQMAKSNIAVNYEIVRILTKLGMYQRAHIFMMEVQRSMLEKGYVRAPELAKLELFSSRKAMQEGNFQVARQGAEFASRLDPLCPWVPMLLIEVELRERPFLNWDLGEVWAKLMDTFHLLRYYDTQALLLLNFSRAARTGLGFFGGLAMLILFGKYFSRISHLWAEKLPQQVDLRVRYLAIGLVFLSLIVGGLGYILVALVMTTLLWKHASPQEKSFLTLVLMGFALIPFFLMWEKSMGRHLDETKGINLYHQAYSRGYEIPLVTRIEAFETKTMEDSLYKSLAFSLTYKKQGNYVKALQYNLQAQEADPGNSIVMLNKGNLAMVEYDYQGASKAYALLRKSEPEMVETWFNSSQAELYSNNSTQHKKFLDRAAEEDPQWVNQFLKDNDENFPEYPQTRKAMDPMLRTGQAWFAAWKALIEFDFLKVRLHTGIYVMLGGWIIGAVGMTWLFVYFRFRRHSMHIQGKDLFDCKICGRVMCRVCRKGVHCNACFKTVSGIQENRVKMEMVKSMRMRAAHIALRAGTVLNILLPGAGFLYLGVGLSRFAWTFVSGLLISGVWQANHLLMEYPAYVLGPLRWLSWLPVAGIYILFNLQMLRMPLKLKDVLALSAVNEKDAIR